MHITPLTVVRSQIHPLLVPSSPDLHPDLHPDSPPDLILKFTS